MPVDYKKLFAAVMTGWIYEHGDSVPDMIASVEAACHRDLTAEEQQAMHAAYAAHIGGFDF